MSAAWRPDPGDTVTGTVLALDEGRNVKQQPYPIVTLDVAGGVVKVHALHQVLQEELAKRRPTIGDDLTISYHGQPDGKDYHHYTVAGGSAPAFDWGRYGDPHAPETSTDAATSRPPASPQPAGPAAPPDPATGGAAPSPRPPVTLATIDGLLEAIWQHNSATADRLRDTLNRQAGGNYKHSLTAEQIVKAAAWLHAKALEAGVAPARVEAVISR